MSIGQVLEEDMYRRVGERIQRGRNVTESGGEKEGGKSIIAEQSDHPCLVHIFWFDNNRLTKISFFAFTMK